MAQGRTRQRTRQPGFGPSTQAGVDAPLSVGQVANAAANINPMQLLQGLVSLLSQENPNAQPSNRARRGVQQQQSPQTNMDTNSNPAGGFAQSAPQDPRSVTTDLLRKVAEKHIKKQAEQGLEAGTVTPEQLLSLSGGQQGVRDTGPIPISGRDVSVTPVNQPQQESGNVITNFLSNLVSNVGSVGGGGGIRLGRSSDYVNLAQEQLLKEQAEAIRFAREEGLTAARQAELDQSFLQNVLANTGQSSLSNEQLKTFNLAKQGLEQTSTLLQGFENDPDIFKGSFPTARNQQIKVIRNNLSDVIGRMRSGGAINADEEKRFMSLLPAQGAIRGRIEQPETVLFKLQTLQRMFSDVVSGTKTSNEASAISNAVVRGIQAGIPISEMKKELGL